MRLTVSVPGRLTVSAPGVTAGNEGMRLSGAGNETE